MPRCNLTLKQKCNIIELYGEMTTEQIAKKFQVHQTTVTRTFQKKQRILDQAARVNGNFKTVQTNQRCQELDEMIIKYIKSRQELNEPVSIKEICDKAIEYANLIDKNIKSRRGWWRRFKVRCNIVRSKCKSINPAKDKKSSGKKKNYTFYIKEPNISIKKTDDPKLKKEEQKS